MSVSPIPDGYHAATPYLTVSPAAEAIDFYSRAFDAQERYRMPGPGGSVMHAEIQLRDSVLMLADESPMGTSKAPKSLGGTSAALLLYTEDVDAAYQQAIEAGAEEIQAPVDMFWGDRYAKVRDPFGHEWMLATHVEDVTPEEMQRRFAAMEDGG
jgi:PhnB protein